MRPRAAAAAAAVGSSAAPRRARHDTAETSLAVFADYLCRWALLPAPARVLEPYAHADAPFLRAIARVSAAPQGRRRASFVVDAVVPPAARAAPAASTATTRGDAAGVARALRAAGAVLDVTRGELFAWLGAQPASARWDAVVGRPPPGPLARLPAPERARAAALCAAAGVPLTRGAAAWEPVVVAAVTRLSPGGRLAVVLPADVLHAAHAEGLRRMLERTMSAVTVVHVRDALAGAPAVLLFATRQRAGDVTLATAAAARRDEDDRAPGTRLRVLDVDDPARLPPLESLDAAARDAAAPLDGRWMRAWLTAPEHALLAQVERARWARPFTAVAAIAPSRGTAASAAATAADGHGGASARGGSGGGGAFVALLARARPDPRLVPEAAVAAAHARASAVYRVRMAPGFERRRAHLVFSFFNSLTLLEAELEGRHDGAGGLLLGPRELARLRVPLAEPTRAEMAALDALLRRGAPPEAILEYTDPRTLGRAGVGGLSAQSIATLRHAWARLRARRLRR